MKVFVIRHGLTELNKKKVVNGQIDEPLAPEGVKQAKAALSFIPQTIKQIYTSPLLRAQQTAKIVNSKLKKPIQIQDELTEIHMGSLAGYSWLSMENGLELKKKHRSIEFDYRPQGGESAIQVKKRIVKFLKKIQGKYQDYEVLIVTHGGIIRLLHLLEHGTQLLDEIEHTGLHTVDLNKLLK